jgi:hypothetical protein
MLKNSGSGTYLIPYRGMGAYRVYPHPSAQFAGNGSKQGRSAWRAEWRGERGRSVARPLGSVFNGPKPIRAFDAYLGYTLSAQLAFCSEASTACPALLFVSECSFRDRFTFGLPVGRWMHALKNFVKNRYFDVLLIGCGGIPAFEYPESARFHRADCVGTVRQVRRKIACR